MSENVNRIPTAKEYHAVLMQQFADWYIDILDSMIHAECEKFRHKLNRKYLKLQEKYISFDTIDCATSAFRIRVRKDVIESMYAYQLKGKKVNAARLIRKSIKQQWMLSYGN